jgi:exopolysaccharide biosynthesis polyprenyl glycosylphosphotransferase
VTVLNPSLQQETNGAADLERIDLSSQTRAILARRRRAKVLRHRGWLIRRMLVVGDVVGLSLAFLAVELIYGDRGGHFDRISLAGEVLLLFVSLPVFVLVARSYGLYSRDEEHAAHSTIEEITGVFQLVTVGLWLLVAFDALVKVASPNLPKLTAFWVFAVTLVPAARASARAICRRRLSYVQNTVIVGAGTVGTLVARKFIHHPEYGINVVGFLDAAPRAGPEELQALGVLGRPEDLAGLVEPLDIERVVIAFSQEDDQATLGLLRQLKDFDVHVDVVPRLFEIVSDAGADISDLEGLPLISLAPPRLSRSSLALKRGMDVTLSSLGLILLAPALALIALLIKLESPGPVLFRQLRMGFADKPFTMFKFRTMVADAEGRKQELAHLNEHALSGDGRLFKIVDDPRTTRIGRVLRRFSLDEIPQLLNVVRGEMSLVGPRPLVLDEDRHVIEWARKRLALKPGITGLWQMLGRNEIPFAEMVGLDYTYVTTWSLFNDLKILLRTLPEIFRVRNGY